MTEHTRPQPLPGLEIEGSHATPLEVAARRTLQQLDQQGMLGEQHALTCQLVLDLARVTGAASQYGKASAAALAAAQLREAIATLPEVDDDDNRQPDAWDELAADLRRASPVRDSA